MSLNAVVGGVASAVVGSALGGSGGSGTTSQSSSTTTSRTYDPFESTQSDRAAGITRGQWDYAKSFYQPLEDELITKSSAVDENQVNYRGGLAQRASESAYQGNLRDLRRQGVTMSGQQKAYLDRMRQLGISTDRAFAQNSDRLGQFERNKNTLAALTGFGRSNLQMANQAVSAAAGMEAARNIQGGYTDTSTTKSSSTSKSKSGGSI